MGGGGRDAYIRFGDSSERRPPSNGEEASDTERHNDEWNRSRVALQNASEHEA
jgi:hypothetical protein